MAGLKRRHEDSCFAAPHPMSEYRSRNMANISTETSTNNYTTGDDRVHSPNSIVDAHTMFLPTRESKRTLSFTAKRVSDKDYDESSDPDAEKRVTIWNWREQRKLSGNSAPFKKNLRDYIRKHPDWEQYLGQDKDSITGKKLSSKKMKPPAPQDPNHPWFTLGDSGLMPSSPSGPLLPPPPLGATPTPSYGTRSTQSRLQDHEGTRSARSTPSRHAMQHTQDPEPPQASKAIRLLNPELFQPLQIKLEAPAAVALRRSIEMAARRQAMAVEADAESTESNHTNEQAELEAAKSKADAWAAASAEVARLEEVRLTRERCLAEEALNNRRACHARQQDTVLTSAMARIEAFKNKRRMLRA